MELLYGTTNQGKLNAMKYRVKSLGIDLIGLNDLDIPIPEVEEVGNSPIENARTKALAYYEVTGMPVFSCDSGLYIEGLDENEQPGVYVRRVNGKSLNDDEMIEYYSNMAKKLGGKALAKYKNAICLVLNNEKIIQYDGDDIASEPFYLVDQVHHHRIEGFPLDSISVEAGSGKYFFDIEEENYEDLIGKGFENFFIRSLHE